MAAMKTFEKTKQEESGSLSRVLLRQVVPLVLMLVVSSWLTLQAGQLIEQQRSPQVTVSLAQF